MWFSDAQNNTVHDIYVQQFFNYQNSGWNYPTTPLSGGVHNDIQNHYSYNFIGLRSWPFANIHNSNNPS